MQTRLKYSRDEINALLEKTLAEIGTERFSEMDLVALERFLRAANPSRKLPGRTIFREIINNFRAARWPETAPRRRS